MQFKVPQNIDLEDPTQQLTGLQNYILSRRALSAGRDSLTKHSLITEVSYAV